MTTSNCFSTVGTLGLALCIGVSPVLGGAASAQDQGPYPGRYHGRDENQGPGSYDPNQAPSNPPSPAGYGSSYSGQGGARPGYDPGYEGAPPPPPYRSGHVESPDRDYEPDRTQAYQNEGYQGRGYQSQGYQGQTYQGPESQDQRDQGAPYPPPAYPGGVQPDQGWRDQGQGSSGYERPSAPPPPPGYQPPADLAAQQAQDRQYEDQAEQWEAASCVRSGGNAAEGAVIGGVLGAVAGVELAGRHGRGAGLVAGGAVGAVAGGSIAASSGGATSPGCPPGYVMRAGAEPFYYAGPVYAAPAWYHPWVYYGGHWAYRRYPYHPFNTHYYGYRPSGPYDRDERR